MAEKKKDKKKSGKETRKKKGKKTVSAAKKVKKPSRPAAAKKRKEVMPEVKQPIEIKPVIISPIEKKLAPRSARNLAKLLVAVFAVLLIIIGSWLWRPYKYCRTVPIMGTFMQVKVVGNGLFRWRLPEEADRAIKLARGLEKKFCIYDP
ncbi:MAG: hypothetical protein ACE5JK_04240, partial [Candidatus Omnitrophota bacterium]